MRGWNRLVKGAVFIAAAFGATGGAQAAAGLTYTSVEALSSVVTYSRPAGARLPALTTYVGYEVTVSNIAGNTINNIVFEGTFILRDQGEQASFASDLTDGASCQVVPKNTGYVSITVRCPVGQLQAGRSKPFSLFFVAPIQDTDSPLDNDYARFSGFVVTAEGANKGNSQNDSVDPWPVARGDYVPDSCPEIPDASAVAPATPDSCVKVLLGTPNDEQVKSAVPKIGGTFFTGEGGITGVLNGDAFTTTVVVPNSSIVAKAAVVETPLTQTGNFRLAYETSLTIDDSATDTTADYAPGLLRIILRMDASNIVPGTKIERVAIKYDGATVAACSVKGQLNSPGVPCINESKYYKNRNVPGWTPELDGDFEWTVLNSRNGRFTIE